jgi:hypothetical protein
MTAARRDSRSAAGRLHPDDVGAPASQLADAGRTGPRPSSFWLW